GGGIVTARYGRAPRPPTSAATAVPSSSTSAMASAARTPGHAAAERLSDAVQRGVHFGYIELYDAITEAHCGECQRVRELWVHEVRSAGEQHRLGTLELFGLAVDDHDVAVAQHGVRGGLAAEDAL